MNDPFVPLSRVPTGRNQNRPDFQAAIVSDPGNLHPFQPMGLAAAKAACGEPRVTLQHEGGRVSAIRLHCSCGQVFELACVYEK